MFVTLLEDGTLPTGQIADTFHWPLPLIGSLAKCTCLNSTFDFTERSPNIQCPSNPTIYTSSSSSILYFIWELLDVTHFVFQWTFITQHCCKLFIFHRLCSFFENRSFFLAVEHEWQRENTVLLNRQTLKTSSELTECFVIGLQCSYQICGVPRRDLVSCDRDNFL